MARAPCRAEEGRLNNCILIGSRSEIGSELGRSLERDGWQVYGWRRGSEIPCFAWDLVILAIGTVAPVGLWHDNEDVKWDDGVCANLVTPVSMVRFLWPLRRKDAAVCFLAGSNPNKPMAGYSAYNAGKMGLLKVVEQLDHETPDAKFFALGPGYIPTKIHKPTLEAGWANERIAQGGGTPLEKVYDCLLWCLEQPKEVIGGRNICVSDPYGPELAERLKNNNALYKLRRVE
jgi:hypothetical protein